MKNNRKPKLSTNIFLKYVRSLAMPLLVIAVVVIFCVWLCGQYIWYQTDSVYFFLKGIKNNLPIILAAIVLIVWVTVTRFYMLRLIKYIDSIVIAAKQLSQPENGNIELPGELHEIERDLNSVRETALRNAEMAREAEKRKNDLVVYLAHDLKTPLTSVIGYLTLLSNEPQLSADIRMKYTDIALDKAERLETLINEFFDITRYNLTQLTLEPVRIDLTLMLNQTVNEFLPTLAEHNLKVKSEIQPNVQLLCDPDKLERVFDNLLRNAVNYSYNDSTILVKMCADENHITVVFRNRGRTIPREKLDKIFEQFFRLDNARQSKTGGSGLGLAIAKEIVLLHGGEITAKSEDENTEFTVVIPV